MQENPVERRVRAAGVVLLAGLAVEVLSLFGRGPVAFLIFSGLATTMIVAGIFFFLHGIVSRTEPRPPDGCD